ncbi:37540_t:CDS:2 [Gigaspora margarita]|uniref:37540_t:CDS:1 n=1 Tax=Gigaspora margarita TaxID=4874 RepID=A0ABN7UBI2_GIGMA|nr:37540_t:CDS:2 [Gigaspora margarita]
MIYPNKAINEENFQLVILTRMVTMSFSIRDKVWCYRVKLGWEIRTMVAQALPEVSEYVIIPEKKTLSRRIRESIFIYLQNLNCGNPKDPFIPFEIPGEDWDKKLDNSCQKLLELNTQKKLNALILEAYYQMGTILAEKEWNDATRKRLNSYFRTEKRKSV